jgi:hypothetical protein
MSYFNPRNWFANSGDDQQKTDDAIRSLDSIKAKRDQLIQEEHYNKTCAKRLLKKDRRRAVSYLGKNKPIRDRINQLNRKIKGAEETLNKASDMEDDVHLLNVRRVGANNMKKIMGKNKIDNVHKELDDIEDVERDAAEFSNRLEDSAIDDFDEDDPDLEDELDALANEDLGDELDDIRTPTAQPVRRIGVTHDQSDFIARGSHQPSSQTTSSSSALRADFF